MLWFCFWKPWPHDIMSFKENIFKKRNQLFINLTIDETLENLQNHFYMLRGTLFSSNSYIDFKVGVDATVVRKSWQILESYGEIVGWSYPNLFWMLLKY